MSRIRIAIAGVGNCASSLLQGIAYYGNTADTTGLLYPDIAGLRVTDIEAVAAFDIDARKVGRPLEDAIFALPNNTKRFVDKTPETGVTVQMGPVLDGVAPHMALYPDDQRFIPSEQVATNLANVLRESRCDILLNYMPVGAQRATEAYAQACLDTGVSLVNCVPCFIVSDPVWAKKFTDRRIPCVGDDVKAQLGATITHRTLARLCQQRGVRIDATYQLNIGGNTDFLNMLSRERLTDKRLSKTQAVQSQLDEPLPADRIHIGPSDYVPFQKDNKVCFMRIEGTGFGGIPMHLELRLSVEDSPNSAGMVVDAIRCCYLARQAGLGGPLEAVSAWTMKRPSKQMTDADASNATAEFIASVQKIRR